MRPFIAVDIEVHQPVPGPSKAYFRPFMGRLQAAMYRDGAVHHFRMVDADGVMWLVPPAWLPSYALQVAEMAMERLDADFLHVVKTVSTDAIWDAFAKAFGCPDGLDRPQRIAWLERRQAERVH